MRVRDGRIDQVAPELRPLPGERTLDLDGLALLPGLINAHDHLHLDLMPRVGNPPYGNSYQWLDDLAANRPPAAAVLARIPARDRFLWGAYRNLLGGVTTVAHHGPMPLRYLVGAELPVRVCLPMAWAESLRDGPDVAARARRARGQMPFALHLADGVDDVAGRELDAFERVATLGPGTLVVHGVGLDPAQRRRLATSGAALVWCPVTSDFLFGRGAAVAELPLVALGTDSTMTGAATMFDELRFAARRVAPGRVYEMVTRDAARALLRPDLGQLTPGSPADLIALPAAASPGEALLAAGPGSLALVVVAGRVRLAARPLARQAGLDSGMPPGFGALVERLRAALPAGYESPATALMARSAP